MKRDRNVKIVATLGPASDDYEMIRALHEAGADVFRLNMSHGDHAEIAVRHAIIRQIEADIGQLTEGHCPPTRHIHPGQGDDLVRASELLGIPNGQVKNALLLEDLGHDLSVERHIHRLGQPTGCNTVSGHGQTVRLDPQLGYVGLLVQRQVDDP